MVTIQPGSSKVMTGLQTGATYLASIVVILYYLDLFKIGLNHLEYYVRSIKCDSPHRNVRPLKGLAAF